MPQSNDDIVILPTMFTVDPGFLGELLKEEGYDLSREEEARLYGLIEEIHVLFEIDVTEGKAWVLGAR